MSEERQNFSARLQESLSKAGYAPDSPTQLARNFNARHAGKPVTIHAARKWIVGEAIPTQEKLRALADWLGVSAEWLRFGTECENSTDTARSAAAPQVAPLEPELLAQLRKLDSRDLELARQMIRLLVVHSREFR